MVQKRVPAPKKKAIRKPKAAHCQQSHPVPKEQNKIKSGVAVLKYAKQVNLSKPTMSL